MDAEALERGQIKSHRHSTTTTTAAAAATTTLSHT
jgi:hypothetical protein